MSARTGTAGAGIPLAERIPVLLYHAVTEDPSGWIAPLTVRPSVFAAQLDAVVDSGCTPLTATGLVDALAGRRPLPERPVVITIDDGFADLPRSTAPALAGRGLTATAYLTTGAIGLHGPDSGCLLPPAPMMTAAQVKETADHGLEIGAHTITHPQLDTLPGAAVRRELSVPKAALEDLLGLPVPAFAYPHGYNSRSVRRQVRAAGYTSATAVRDALSSKGDEPYRIARIMLRADDTAADVAAWLRGTAAPVAPYPDQLRTVGWRWYRRGRRLVRGTRFAG
ncbi:polysaccharide deacetylase family protein [Streptacidiphilus carbonis]|uniref:polysaccharide deacetylase family protein n=1 Tax=Streptacidiphilus carbonis TaxID=105422 RepID=UPI0005A6DEAB|nr:polysaccharide deacetylase family protein [Streptacidiphilus carbonis]